MSMSRLRGRCKWIISLLFLSLLVYLSAMRNRAPTTKAPKFVMYTAPAMEDQEAPPGRDVPRVVHAAATILEKRPVLVTIINDGFVRMAYNWLCHTASVAGLHDDILMLAEDDATRRRVQRDWPRLHVMSLASANNNSKDENSRQGLGGQLKFNTAGYVRMMALRTRLLNELVQTGIPFVLFEMDFVWFQNPVPDFLALAEKEDLDLVGTKSSVKDQIMCGAFIFFRNTPRTRAVWGEVTRMMGALTERMSSLETNDTAPPKENEQRYLNRLLKENYKGIRFGLVDFEGSVIDGAWYNLEPEKRGKLKPKSIHNNFLETTREKIKRFRKFGQWVLNDNDTCNEVKVRQLLTSGNKGR